jgi:lactate dehydrogenase-like 2-hydroxyacid dehydrogenase
MVALRAGRLAAAAIGVYDAQRPIIDYPFRSPDNETIMPHP